MEKAIIFDASSLISLSMNGLLPKLKELKETFEGHFILTKEVKYEVVERPMKINKFKLEALTIEKMLEEGVLERPNKIKGINEKEISKRTQEIMRETNSFFKSKGKDVEIIDLGEASCLAMSEILEKRKIKNVIAMDERTTRVVIENPKKLQTFLEHKFHTQVKSTSSKKQKESFQDFKVIRSAELMYIAYKKGLFDFKKSGKEIIEAVLFALKNKGCAISTDEIHKIKKLA